MPEPDLYRISPIGAAIVEAMPDRKAVARIKRQYRIDGTCPTSAVYPTVAEIQAYYLTAADPADMEGAD